VLTRSGASRVHQQFQRGFAQTKGDAQKPRFTDEKEVIFKKPVPPPKIEPKPIGSAIFRAPPVVRIDVKSLPPSTDDPKREAKKWPRNGIAYMGGIPNPNAEFEHTAFRLEKPISLAKARAEGCRINLPVREYYADPVHWKFGKSHLLLALEWDFMHIWVRPPNGQAFPPCDHARLDALEFQTKYPFYVPPLHRMVPYANDWVITDLHTFFVKTQAWTVPLLEKALGCKLFKSGTPEYTALAAQDDLEGKPLTESDDSWVGPNYLRKLIAADKAAAAYQKADV